MIELGVPQHLISRIIGEDGLINFLPVIPPEDVLLGVDFIRERAMEEDHTAKLDIFWRYFRKTWMKYRPTIRTQVTITLTILIYIYSLIQYTLIYTLILALIHTGTGVYLTSSWNIYHLIQEDGSLMETEDGLDVMINRTNNLQKTSRTAF